MLALLKLLIVGRHLAHTIAQRDAIARQGDVDQVIFAITSANQDHCRFSPLPFFARAIGVDRFARDLGVRHRIIGVPHYRPTDRYARHTIEEIEQHTEGELCLCPADTRVMTGPSPLADAYAALGFEVEIVAGPQPLDVIVSLSSGASIKDVAAPSTIGTFDDFPELVRRVLRIYRDPLLNDQGSLTDTRDYGQYRFAMSNEAIIDIKYGDVQPWLRGGRIADEGCADGALLVRVARDDPDSDLIGIEITGEFLAQCKERQRRGDFGGNYVHFHQRNLFQEVFEAQSIDTTICNSTLHELWSYGDGEQTVRSYLARKFEQTAPGGRIIIRDVVGPEDGDAVVDLWCNAEDGAAEGPVEGLSTRARFERFADDFIAAPFSYERNGDRFRLKLRDASEFMTKKDYTHNWASEMHETFAFWSLGEWQDALRDAGFDVVDGSRAFLNPWIAQNRYEGKVRLERDRAPIEFPVTTMVLVGARRS